MVPFSMTILKEYDVASIESVRFVAPRCRVGAVLPGNRANIVVSMDCA